MLKQRGRGNAAVVSRLDHHCRYIPSSERRSNSSENVVDRNKPRVLIARAKIYLVKASVFKLVKKVPAFVLRTRPMAVRD